MALPQTSTTTPFRPLPFHPRPYTTAAPSHAVAHITKNSKGSGLLITVGLTLLVSVPIYSILTSERGKIGGRFDQRDRRAEEIRRLHADD